MPEVVDVSVQGGTQFSLSEAYLPVNDFCDECVCEHTVNAATVYRLV